MYLQPFHWLVGVVGTLWTQINGSHGKVVRIRGGSFLSSVSVCPRTTCITGTTCDINWILYNTLYIDKSMLMCYMNILRQLLFSFSIRVYPYHVVACVYMMFVLLP